MGYARFSPRTNGIASALAVAVSLAILGGCSARTHERSAAEPDRSAPGGDPVGDYMDRQAEELSRIEGARTERIGDDIRVTWSSAILFDFDSAMLKWRSQENLKTMAEVFRRYRETDIVITGHTDNRGSENYNLKLSERRALSVRNYLAEMGVAPARLETAGFGELRPIADNETEEGRRRNRRVEIEIRPNENMRAQAAGEEGSAK